MSVGTYLQEGARVVGEAVDPDSCRAAEIMSEDQGRTVLFESLNGGRAVGNLFSTREKVACALGIPRDEIARLISDAAASPCDVAVTEAPAFMERSLPVDLESLPLCRYFPGDGGRYISSGVVVSEQGGKRNASFHRMMLMGGDSLAIRLVPRHLFTMHRRALEAGEELSVAVCIGTCPEVMLAAATSASFEADELRIASAMRMRTAGRPLEVGRAGNGLAVPADCDYVLEGRITSETADEGPFVDITGTYDCVRSQPVLRIDRVRSKRDPLMQLLLPGGSEHYLFMGLPREPMMLDSVRRSVPRAVAVRLTEGGCCWLHGVVSIRKSREGDGVNAALAAFAGHPSMKHVVVVDDDIDIFDDRQVEWAVATRFQADRAIRIPGAAGSSLDPSAPGTTWKVGIDATMPMGAERALFERARLRRPGEPI